MADYYAVPWVSIPLTGRGAFPFSDWQPDNLVVTIRLQRVEHPIPLFVKRVSLRNAEKGIGGFDGTNSVVRFDLMKGDWLPPYGNGERADLVFHSHVKVTDKERKFMYATKRVEDILFYDLTTQIKVVGEKDGLGRVSVKPASGIQIRQAAKEMVSRGIVNKRGIRKKVNAFKEWQCEFFADAAEKEEACYQFRIRSRFDEKGQLTEAYYGKIYGGIKIEGDEKRGLVGISFTYYLNPTSLDRNLEWDRKQNLCPIPGCLGWKLP